MFLFFIFDKEVFLWLWWSECLVLGLRLPDLHTGVSFGRLVIDCNDVVVM